MIRLRREDALTVRLAFTFRTDAAADRFFARMSQELEGDRLTFIDIQNVPADKTAVLQA